MKRPKSGTAWPTSWAQFSALLRSKHELRGFLTRAFAQPRSWFRAITQRSRLEKEMEAELRASSRKPDCRSRSRGPATCGRWAKRTHLARLLPKYTKKRCAPRWGCAGRMSCGPIFDTGFASCARALEFTAIAATSLALAIGANTTIFSIAKQLLYQRLNVPHSEQLRMLALEWRRPRGHSRYVGRLRLDAQLRNHRLCFFIPRLPAASRAQPMAQRPPRVQGRHHERHDPRHRAARQRRHGHWQLF